MAESESHLVPTDPAAPATTLESLQESYRSLRRCFHITMLMFIILATSLFVFFLREVSLARRQITELTKVVMDYEREAVPLMEDFRAKLQVFARTHPDFNPIYVKYFGATNLQTTGASPGRAQPLTNGGGPRLPPAR